MKVDIKDVKKKISNLLDLFRRGKANRRKTLGTGKGKKINLLI